MSTARFIVGDVFDVLASLPDASVDCVVTSPPYLQQRRYTDDPREVGCEPTLDAYVEMLAGVFDQVRRVLTPAGVAWLNIGDKANGSGGAGGDWVGSSGGPRPFTDPAYSPRTFLDVPGAALRALILRGWLLRMPVVWDKQREAPESLVHTGRPKWAHEMVYMLATSSKPWFRADALVETGSVWHFPPSTSDYGHLAPFPDELPERCILATCPERVCETCGAPSRPLTKPSHELDVTRPQARRAMELAAAAGLTAEHFDAVRSCGISDTGKALVTSNGAGRNSARVQALADEVKAALGGYFREYLLGGHDVVGWSDCGCCYRAHGETPPPEPVVEYCRDDSHWRRGVVLDPFAGSGTTLSVAVGHGRDAIGIDIDERNATLASERVGMFLTVEHHGESEAHGHVVDTAPL